MEIISLTKADWKAQSINCCHELFTSLTKLYNVWQPNKLDWNLSIHKFYLLQVIC